MFATDSTVMADNNGYLLKRAIALIIDQVLLGTITGLVLVATVVLTMAGVRAGGLLSATLLPLLGLVTIVYYVYFEGSRGQTLGKMLLDLKVVTEDGSDIGYVDSAVRNLLRVIDYLPFFYIIGIVAIIMTDKGQRVGDLAASTVVREA
jgi:uncharacterized RDD family membrane protein YckC